MDTVSGELTLAEAALRLDLTADAEWTVLDHLGRAIGTITSARLRETPAIDRTTILVANAAEPAPEQSVLSAGARWPARKRAGHSHPSAIAPARRAG